MEAEIQRRSNLPFISRKFRDVARLAVERLEHEIAIGKGKSSYTDYIRVIQDYLIPILGKRSITSINYQALDELNIKCAEMIEKVPTQSTMLPHNAALNRVRDGFTANTLTHIINGIYSQAGIANASSHSGRRSGLTTLAEKGVSVRVVVALAGHSQKQRRNAT